VIDLMAALKKSLDSGDRTPAAAKKVPAKKASEKAPAKKAPARKRA
jgi:DNA end-binding protein Ku